MLRLRPGARRWVALGLAAIVLLGGALRASAAADPLPERSPDEASYARLAFSITRGAYGDAESGLKRPLHWPPGAPFMFAASRVFDRSPDLGAAYWMQALVGTLTIVACSGIAALAAGPAAGLVAAALVAVYPPSIALTSTLQSEPLGALLAALAVLAAAWALRRDGRLRWWALCGVLFGGAVLTRTDLLLGPPLVAGIVALVLPRRLGLRSALTSAAVLLAAYVVAIAPWTVYVSDRAGKFTPVTEGDAAALFVGSYLPGDGTTFGMKRDLADELRARNPELRGIRNPDAIEARAFLDFVSERRPELSREAALQAEARANLRRYALGQPVAFAGMMVDKVRRTWFLSSRAGAKDKSTAVRVYHAVLVALCCLAMVIAVALRRSAVVGICLALVAYSMLLHAVFVAKPRYALPLMPLLMVGGVVAIATLLAGRRAGSSLGPDGRSTVGTASAVAADTRRRTERTSDVSNVRRTAAIVMSGLAMTITGATVAQAGRVDGGAGADRLGPRGSGPAVLHGLGGSDELTGGPLADELYGETGPDVLRGGPADDLLDGGTGNDQIAGEDGSDTLVGSFGDDLVTGGPGDDVIDAGESPDDVDGGPGDDRIHAGSAPDVVRGGIGNDTIWLDSGPDRIDAGEGDDVVYANNGTWWEMVDCGPGEDTIYINPVAGKGDRRPVTSAAGNPNGATRDCEHAVEQEVVKDPSTGIMDKSDSEAGETLTGTEANDKLLGGPGPDRISGGAGDDILWGHHQSRGASLGTDVIEGGAGNDSIWGNRNRTLTHGGTGDDYLQGGELHNTIYGEEGDDTIKLRGNHRGKVGRNRVLAGAGDDTITASGTLKAVIDCGPGRDRLDVGFNRSARWNGSCENVKKGYK